MFIETVHFLIYSKCLHNKKLKPSRELSNFQVTLGSLDPKKTQFLCIEITKRSKQIAHDIIIIQNMHLTFLRFTTTSFSFFFTTFNNPRIIYFDLSHMGPSYHKKNPEPMYFCTKFEHKSTKTPMINLKKN